MLEKRKQQQNLAHRFFRHNHQITLLMLTVWIQLLWRANFLKTDNIAKRC